MGLLGLFRIVHVDGQRAGSVEKQDYIISFAVRRVDFTIGGIERHVEAPLSLREFLKTRQLVKPESWTWIYLLKNRHQTVDGEPNKDGTNTLHLIVLAQNKITPSSFVR